MWTIIGIFTAMVVLEFIISRTLGWLNKKFPLDIPESGE